MKKRLNPNSYGLQVFLEINIVDCYQYSIKFSKRRRDQRRLENFGFDRLKIYPNDKTKFDLEHFESSKELSRTIGGKKNFFDVRFSNIECRHMDTDPNLSVTVRKSPWSNTMPQLIIKATVYDANGQKITYYPFRGAIHEYDKKIDIVKR